MENRTTVRRVSCFSLVLAGLLGSATFAAEPSGAMAPAADPAPLDRCAALADPVEPLLVDFGFHAQCTAIAECAPFTDVSCNQGGTCTGVDRNCNVGERGYVTCSGTTTYCGGACCGSDGVCEVGYGCSCEEDPDCAGHSECPPCECAAVTNCRFDSDCCTPGSVCTSSGICVCTS